MRTRARLLAACLGVLSILLAPASARAVPAGFFGIDPQTPMTDADVAHMSAGGIGSVRIPVSWAGIQSSEGTYDWSAVDTIMATIARGGLSALPVLYGTPGWLERKVTTLPVGDRTEREAWIGFVRAIVERYGSNGAFWREHGPLSLEPLPQRAVRIWQVWNEANFHYFTFPVSPRRYARLLKITAPAIRGVDPRAKVLLSGLFGKPGKSGQGAREGMSAAKFLSALYRTRGLARTFDAVALHPYAANLRSLKRIVGELHRVMVKHHARSPLYITEIGWGSQNDPHVIAYEKGLGGQARELRRAYGYLLRQRHRLRLRGVYWFAWKDLDGSCSFCDSVGLFRGGAGFHPKPAWRAFVKITGGRPSP